MLVLYASAFAACSVAGEPTFNPEELIQSSDVFSKRLAKETASWTCTMFLEQGRQAVVDIVQSNQKRRIAVSLVLGRQRSPLFTIIEREGRWYVEERNGISGMYRPFEAPFNLSAAYQFLTELDLRRVTHENIAEFGTLAGRKDAVLEFTAPLSESVQKLVNDQLKKIADLPPEFKQRPESIELEKKLRAALKGSFITHIDSNTGVLIGYVAARRGISISDVRFAAEDAAAFSTDKRQWEDHSSQLTAEDLGNCILINHCAIWTPENDSQLTPDIRLFNLKTQELRRVPIKALEAGSGCFLKDRSKVIISAVVGRPAGLRLCEIDLMTGANRLIGNSFPEGAALLGGVLSHDGEKLAVEQANVGPDVLSNQIYILDLKTDKATPLGEPADIAFPNWLPEDKGLIIVKRRSVDLDKPSIETLCMLDMQGKLTEIRAGGHPILLADGKTILFEDADRAWHLCDLNGKVLKDLTNGTQWHVLNSLTPAGDKILGVKNARQGRGPEPIIFDPKDGSEVPLTTIPGLWTQPVGR
jgi:hypothetical protein